MDGNTGLGRNGKDERRKEGSALTQKDERKTSYTLKQKQGRKELHDKRKANME